MFVESLEARRLLAYVNAVSAFGGAGTGDARPAESLTAVYPLSASNGGDLVLDDGKGVFRRVNASGAAYKRYAVGGTLQMPIGNEHVVATAVNPLNGAVAVVTRQLLGEPGDYDYEESTLYLATNDGKHTRSVSLIQTWDWADDGEPKLTFDAAGRLLYGTASYGDDDVSIHLARLTATGDVDTSFSGDGQADLDETKIDGEFLDSLELDGLFARGDGDYTVVLRFDQSLPASERTVLRISRVDPNGVLRSGFGSGGSADVTLRTYLSSESGRHLQNDVLDLAGGADGAVYLAERNNVVGYDTSEVSGSDSSTRLLRIAPDGKSTAEVSLTDRYEIRLANSVAGGRLDTRLCGVERGIDVERLPLRCDDTGERRCVERLDGGRCRRGICRHRRRGRGQRAVDASRNTDKL